MGGYGHAVAQWIFGGFTLHCAALGAGSDGALPVSGSTSRRFFRLPRSVKLSQETKCSNGGGKDMKGWKSAVAIGSPLPIVLAILLTAGTGAAQGPAPGTEDPNNWPQYHRTYNGWRYSPLDQINKANVSKLKVAWIHQGGDITMGLQETPTVIDGVVYSISAGNRVAALDAKTGVEIWRYQPKLDPITKKVLFSPYSRGVAVGRGKVFIGTVDGRGIAVDQKTGKEIWQVQLTDFANCHGCNFTSPPVLANDVLTFGSTAGELATAGKIFGVDGDTGEKLWEFETLNKTPRAGRPRAESMAERRLATGHLRSRDGFGLLWNWQSRKGFRRLRPRGDNLYTDRSLPSIPRPAR
jgi:alcohol dehydrogenase (cytochrome c)